MESSGRKLSTILMFMLLLIFAGMGPSEARMCESKSHRFNGPCFRSSNCASICHTEGFPGGSCKGFRRRCFCTSHC